MGFVQQFTYLFYRNGLITVRKRRDLVLLTLLPIYYTVILVIIARFLPNTTYDAVSFSPPVPLPVGPVVLNELFLPQGPKVIGYVPANSTAVDRVMHLIALEAFALSPNTTLRAFDSDADALTYYVEQQDLYLVVEFTNLDPIDGSLPHDVHITYRFNGSYTVSTLSTTQGLANCRGGLGQDGCNVNGYLTSGFLDLQAYMAAALSAELFGTDLGTAFNVTARAQAYPMASLTQTSIALLNLASIYMVVAFSPVAQILLFNVVYEKEKKLKEGMTMMGLSELAYLLAWFAFYAVFVLVVTVIMAILLSKFVIQGASVAVLWGLLLLYGLSLIAYSFALTPFFGKSKVAGAFGSILTVVLSAVYVPLAGTGTQASAAAKWGCSLLSPVALALGISEAVSLVANDLPVNGATIATSTLTQGYSIQSAYVMLFVDIVLYLTLAWYFDNVVPTEFGVKRPWYFVFQPSYWLSVLSSLSPASSAATTLAAAGAATTIGMATLAPEEDNDNVERVNPELQRELALDIRGVHKVFKAIVDEYGSTDKVALDGVSLQLFKGQIFGLLGHNGAGKSTLVSILTGLFEPTAGKVTVFGRDAATSMHELRSVMGVCPQQNILFNELTVREHLVIFAGFKGVQGDLDAQVDRILHQIDLVDSSDKRSATLSGGQKRKLSVGIALIGDPKIVFLDEPTAGMDPYSRRKIWDLLLQHKKDRVILLTSHHLDEIE